MPIETKNNWRRFLSLGAKVLLALISAGALVYWLWFVPMPVLRHTAAPAEIVVEVMGTGTLDAHVKATISTKISGRLKAVLVDQGDSVKAEQEVARLDENDLAHEVEVEEANVASKSAAVARLQADITQAKAVLTQATTNESRVGRMLMKSAASQDDVDKAIESLGVAKAGLARAEAALVEGERQVVVASKTLEFRRSRLEDTVIRSPFDGVIIRRDRNVGDVVVPGSSIFAVVSTDELWVNAWVEESSMAGVRPHQPARVVFRSRPEAPLAGKVIRTGRETDSETREFLVDVVPAKLPEDWSVGQRAEVYIETERKQAKVTIPPRYLFRQAGKPMVFVDAGGRSQSRAVTLGVQNQKLVEILAGLEAGEVVLAPAMTGAKLTPGQRVSTP